MCRGHYSKKIVEKFYKNFKVLKFLQNFKMIFWLIFFTLPANFINIALSNANQHVNITGPGLQPDKIVMPARYFFVKFVEPYDVKDLLVDIKGSSDRGNCRVWINKLDRKDGVVIVRYKIFETCYDFTIDVLYKGRHIGGSPYNFLGNIYYDDCNCPNKDIDTWLKQFGCPNTYPGINEDLKPFHDVDMQVAIEKMIAIHHKPESTSFCHYVVKDNRIYRKCYGKHVGFNMFSDSILLSLTRKVKLPNLELIINLGDWPLIHKGSELLPVFSWCGSDGTHDIILPTYDITESTLENMGRVTLDMLSVQGNVEKEWSERESRAFWRGRDSRRERLDLIDIARANPDLFNASLTNFFFFRDQEDKYGPKQPHVSFYKFFDYKYQLNIDGTVAAYRLPYLLAGGGLVLKQESPFHEHFYRDLTPWKHYIPVRRDLSDLVAQVQWAKEHDHQAKEIAKNGQIFANEHLLPQHIICYHVAMFLEWSKRLVGDVVVQEDMTEVPQVQHKCSCDTDQITKDEL